MGTHAHSDRTSPLDCHRLDGDVFLLGNSNPRPNDQWHGLRPRGERASRQLARDELSGDGWQALCRPPSHRRSAWHYDPMGARALQLHNRQQARRCVSALPGPRLLAHHRAGGRPRPAPCGLTPRTPLAAPRARHRHRLPDLIRRPNRLHHSHWRMLPFGGVQTPADIVPSDTAISSPAVIPALQDLSPAAIAEGSLP